MASLASRKHANAFVLPFGMMSPTLHDVAAIVSLLVDGDEIPFLHDVIGRDLGFHVNKKNNAYLMFINTFNRGSNLISEIEHKVFLLLWIYYFFVCTSSVVVVREFAPHVIAILNQSYLNNGAFFLSLVYKGLLAMVSRMKKSKSVNHFGFFNSGFSNSQSF